MGFKSRQVAIATTDTEVFQMGVGLSGVVVVSVGNQTSGAIAFTAKVFKQSTGLSTTIVTAKSAPANDIRKIDPIALEAGDKIIMSGISTGLTASALVTDSSVAAAAKGYKPRGTYSSIATYDQNDVVAGSDDGSYISMDDDNTGNDPVSSPTFWMKQAGKGLPGTAGDTAMSIVRVVASTNIAISTALENGDALDGVTLATGDLVLLAGQTLGAENGVYAVPASGAASRAAAFNTYDSHPGRYFSVMEGTVGADKLYRCTSNKGGTLGTTAIVIAEFSAGNKSAFASLAQVRATLTQGAAVTTSDVTGASTVFVEPFNGASLSLYDSTSSSWVTIQIAPSTFSISNSGLSSNKMYDVFGYLSSGTLALELLAWTNDTTRATAITQQDGIDVKSGNATRRLLATVRTDGSTLFHDSMARRWVSNRNNVVIREMKVIESTANWNYSSAVWRQFNNNTANQLDFVSCTGGVPAEAEVIALAANSTATLRGVSAGIGLDNATTNNAVLSSRYKCDNGGPPTPLTAKYRGYPGAGRHFFAALEYGAGSDTQTWFSFIADNLFQGGISGSVWG